jgi:hypothetical protein
MTDFKSVEVFEDDVKMVRFRLNAGWDYVWLTYHQEKGFISITSSYGNWSYIWSSMGEGTTLSQFFSQADKFYLSNKLWDHKQKKTYFDLQQGITDIKEEILRERKEEVLSRKDARNLYDLVEDLEEVDGYDDPSEHRFMEAFMDHRILSEWNQEPWESHWGMVAKTDFVYLQDHIIPLIQKYFRGEKIGEAQC